MLRTMNANPDGAVRFEDLWTEHRRRVLDVGYRMLGSLTDAEDVAQEAYARLVVADIDAIDDSRGWLVAVASRICIDRLRAHEHSRRSYVGPWLLNHWWPTSLLSMLPNGSHWTNRCAWP
jgi:DNA-directed RNA polymerase specialized sigma24 family protein